MSNDQLSIRARPRPVRRFSRKALILGGGATALLIMGSLAIAMQPAKEAPEPEKAIYNTNTKRLPEGLKALPVSYANTKQAVTAPKLGPPLPGDLGAAYLQAQNLPRPQSAPRANPFRYQPANYRTGLIQRTAPKPVSRTVELAETINEAPLFFTISSSRKLGAISKQVEVLPTGLDMLRELLPSGSQSPSDLLQSFGSLGGQEPNGQSQKRAFTDAEVDKEIYNPHQLQSPVSPYQVMAGTIIPASLITGLNSDLPGQIIAQVTENVYDTVSGQYLLIPQGARLLGRYDNAVSFGQKRALVVWTRLIMPNGTSMIIDNLPGVDMSGGAGLHDKVNYHYGKMLKAALISTILGVGSELGRSDDDSDLLNAIRDSGQNSFNHAGQQIIERNLGVQPTITVRPGTRLRVIVNKDLILQPYQY